MLTAEDIALYYRASRHSHMQAYIAHKTCDLLLRNVSPVISDKVPYQIATVNIPWNVDNDAECVLRAQLCHRVVEVPEGWCISDIIMPNRQTYFKSSTYCTMCSLVPRPLPANVASVQHWKTGYRGIYMAWGRGYAMYMLVFTCWGSMALSIQQDYEEAASFRKDHWSGCTCPIQSSTHFLRPLPHPLHRPTSSG